jgi:NAD(P)-dependent dehydrogenase (short-subunit alcohol dehydrogenase family)
MSTDFKDRGIRVNTLSPGPIDTPMLEANEGSKEQADALRAGFIRGFA